MLTLRIAQRTRLLALAAALGALPAHAGHGEAPASARDPSADFVDLYLFRSPENLNSVTIVATLWPFSEPGAGPSRPHFDPEVRYNLKIDSNGDAREDIVYEFRFTNDWTAGDATFQYAQSIQTQNPPDMGWLVRQRMSVTHVEVERNQRTPLVQNGIVAAHNVGTISPGYEMAARQTIQDVSIPNPGGGAGRIFVGPRDDPAFADLGALSDRWSIRSGQGNMGGGVDQLSGYNVLAIVLQVPIQSVTVTRAPPTVGQRPGAIVGVWATAERRRVSIRGGGQVRNHGPWEQVSRVGLPLINTWLTPIARKDAYNALAPRDDATNQTFMVELTTPDVADELAMVYMVDFVAPMPPRTDLVGILAGNLHLGERATSTRYLFQPADILRLDLTLPSSPLDGTNNRLGAVGGQNGFPNGRRLDDDAVDITLRMIGGWFNEPSMRANLNGNVGDGVDQNDVAFQGTFPYLAPPHRGADRGGHSIPPRR